MRHMVERFSDLQVMTLTAPAHLIGRYKSGDPRVPERQAWIAARRSEGHSFKAIGEALGGLSSPTVVKILDRAPQHVRQQAIRPEVAQDTGHHQVGRPEAGFGAVSDHDIYAAQSMWSAAAELALHDHYRLIEPAREGQRKIRIDNAWVAVGSEDDEIRSLRRYLHSRDWDEVSMCAGLDCDPDLILQAIIGKDAAERRRYRSWS